jgi:hypothetical protein
MTRTLILALLALGVVSAAAQEAPEVAEASRRSTSYQLFAIDGSGVTGTLNVTERAEGGTLFVVTIVGISPGEFYLPVLFRGDCGPDRERVVELPPVGSIPEDSFASLSHVSLSFSEVDGGDYFLYIYRGEEERTPLACGEVGLGANR